MEDSSGDIVGNSGGNDATTEENGELNKPKRRAVRAEWYTLMFRGTMYQIKTNSPLGETYRNLATKAEQRDSLMEYGEKDPKPYVC